MLVTLLSGNEPSIKSVSLIVIRMFASESAHYKRRMRVSNPEHLINEMISRQV